MTVVFDKGRTTFLGEDNKPYMDFYNIKGNANWCKVLEPDQYDNYAVDIFPSPEDMNKFKETAQALCEEAKALCEAEGKKVNGIADYIKESQDGKEYIQFKRKGTKGDGSPNTPPKIFDAGGNHIEDWDKLIGNGSRIQVAAMLSPYYMASTKMVGVSLKFYAVQVIKLVEYKKGSNASPFGDETDSAPFDTDNEEF